MASFGDAELPRSCLIGGRLDSVWRFEFEPPGLYRMMSSGRGYWALPDATPAWRFRLSGSAHVADGHTGSV